jgi:DNA-binding NtrC family response regulator
MTNHAPSLPRTDEIPQATVSEIKLIGEPHGASLATAVSHAGGLAASDGPRPLASLSELDADWPTLSLLSRRYINRALGHTQGNKTRAADMLGIDRRTLNRIMARDRARKARPEPVKTIG